jgi:hypothetical protein
MSRGRKKNNNYGVIGGLRVSKHAHERMKSRNISIKEVKNTLGRGQHNSAEGNRTYIRSKDGVLVVVDFEEQEIITVVREITKEEAISLLRSELKKFLKSDVLNKKDKNLLGNKEEVTNGSKEKPTQNQDNDEISLEDYLNGNFFKE